MANKIYYNQSETNEGSGKARWWLEDKKEVHKSVFSVKQQIESNSSTRRSNFVRYAQFYNDLPIRGITATTFNRLATNTKVLSGRMSYNVTKVCIDAVSAKLAKNKPRPMFITEKGNYSLQRRAKNLSMYIEGSFDSIGTGSGDYRTMYGIGRRTFVDSAVYGLGAIKFFRQGNEVKAEKVNVNELFIDDIDGMNECPRQIHQVKLMHRDVIAELFPKHYGHIAQCKSGNTDLDNLTETTTDMIEVVESWHLPSGENAKDGMHCISIENATLFCEEYKKDYYPFVFLRWTPSLIGFWGIGIAEELQGLQLEINKILGNIQQAQHLLSVPQVWLDISNRANNAKMSNKIGQKNYYTGSPPTFMTPTAMNSEIYQHLERLYQKAFEIVGVSQLSAQSKKPAGLESAVALREFQDIESERFMLAGQRYEDMYLDATRIIIDMTCDIYDGGIDPTMTVKDDKFMKSIKWSDCYLEKNKYHIRVFPAGSLPTTPAGRLQKVQELTQAGFFSKEEAYELLEMPDLKGQASITMANRNAVKRMVEKILEDGIPQVPEPPMDLAFALKWAQTQYNMGIAEDYPEDRLELLLRFMDDVNSLLNPPMPEAPAMMPQAPAEVPMEGAAVPEPLPTSDLMSQIPQ